MNLDEAMRRVHALLSDPHPGLATWCAAFVKAQRDLGFEPIRQSKEAQKDKEGEGGK